MNTQVLTPLRLVAAMIVVVFHAGRELTFLPNFLFQGPEMVTFFFVLSGLVLTVAYHQRSFTYTGFMRSRLARIAPVYLLALAMVAMGRVIKGTADPLGLLLSISFLQSWIPGYALTLNSPGWSLSVEMFMYLMFPLLLPVFAGYPVRRLLAALMLLWAVVQGVDWWMFAADESLHWLNYFPPLHLISFMLGMAGGLLLLHSDAALQMLRGPLPLLLATGLVVLVVQNADQISGQMAALRTTAGLYAPVFLVFMLSVVLNAHRLAWLATRPLVLLGEASYAMYILQVPIYSLCKPILHRVLHDPLLIFVAYACVLMLVSTIVHLWLEVPANRFLRRWRTSKA